MATKTVTATTAKKAETAKKTETAKTAVKTAPIKTEAAKTPEVKKEETKAPVVKKETAAEPAKKTAAEPVKKTAVEKAPAKKAPAKKPAAKKTNVKKELKVNTYVQYAGNEIEEKNIIANVKKAWTGSGKKVGDIESVTLYVKPEENSVYYVINGSETGAVSLF